MARSKAGFADSLIRWYRDDHRQLPWRETTDPYRIWVSEVMLQQTQAATVIPYYERFLTRYSSVVDLAAAPLSEVLKMWEGLGYYSRCRNLHLAAQAIVNKHGGHFPDELNDAVALPGIGLSTAGAILTFGYGQRHALLDGNVVRVLTRLFDVELVAATAPAKRLLWEHSKALLAEATDPQAYNQAIMELGATCCTSRNPSCAGCPVRPLCQAFEAGTIADRPKPVKKKPVPHFDVPVALIKSGSRLLMKQRPPSGLLAGMWEFPGGRTREGEGLEEALQRTLRDRMGLEVSPTRKVAQVGHAFSHFKITLHAFECEWAAIDGEPQSPSNWGWCDFEDRQKLAMPKATLRVLDVLRSELTSREDRP